MHDSHNVSVGRRDRLSELPDSLIHLILSHLPIRDVVSTTLVSKRWNNLWTTVPSLNFCNLSRNYTESEAKRLRKFVNRALIIWSGLRILKFKFHIHWPLDSVLAGDIDLWVRFAVKNELEVLNIRLMMDKNVEDNKKSAYRTPLCLNSCSSLKELSLVGCILCVPESPSWKQLTSLKIDGFHFSERLINTTLLGSPLLQVFELRFVESYENLNIQSASLKKLKIDKYLISEDSEQPSTDKLLRIHCPNLEILQLSGALYSNNANRAPHSKNPASVTADASSLTDLTLELNGSCDYAGGNELVEEALKQIFTPWGHVDKVKLSPWCVQVLGALQNKCLPNVKFFPNVKMLVIEDKNIQDAPEFDEEEEVVKGPEYETKLSKSFVVQLKTVDITTSFHSTSTLRFIEFLLKDASMLETLVLRVKLTYYMDWFDVAEKLLCLPRSSPTAKVILKRIDHWGC